MTRWRWNRQSAEFGATLSFRHCKELRTLDVRVYVLAPRKPSKILTERLEDSVSKPLTEFYNTPVVPLVERAPESPRRLAKILSKHPATVLASTSAGKLRIVAGAGAQRRPMEILSHAPASAKAWEALTPFMVEATS